MASVVNDPNGRKRILFTDGEGERKAIRLGKATVKAAESFGLRVETLLSDKALNRAHDAELCAWLNELPERIYTRLVRVGLADSRTLAAVPTLAHLLQRFEDASVVKASTKAAYKQTIDSLRHHLKPETPLDTIDAAEADRWRKAIADSGLAAATVAKRVHVARTIFRRAVRWGLMPTSPFADLRAGSQSNPDRAYYVPVESIHAILAACPDDQWRAIVALSRFAGLRCPSEIVLLRWGDVNWERGRLTVRSPKTAGHDGHAARVVPIGPELRPILQRLFDQAEPGSEPVVPRLRDPKVNLRTTFERIITSASVAPWPRLFHNMRASCACDWVERFPAHVVASWLGHSPLIAARHYLQTRDAHFDLAAGVTPGRHADEKSGALCGAPEAQNAAQHPTALGRADSPEPSKESVFSGVSQADAKERETATKQGNGRNRTRTRSENKAISGDGEQSGAKSGALCDDSGVGGGAGGGGGGPSPVLPTLTPTTPADPELAAVAAAWASLPPAVRAGIVAMVRAAVPGADPASRGGTP